MDALISFVLTGEPRHAKRALPPQYISFVVSRYGYASALIGGEDGVIRVVGSIITSGLKAKYGTINGINYTIADRRRLTVWELEALSRSLPQYGVTTEPSEAHEVTLCLLLDTASGQTEVTIMPRVLLLDGKWYIHPADIESLYS